MNRGSTALASRYQWLAAFAAIAVIYAFYAHAQGVEKVALTKLGRALFSASQISSDGALSCASCHDPTRSYTDPYERSLARRHVMTRNAPSLLSLFAYTSFSWDGRSQSLVEQVRQPLVSRLEIGATPDRIRAFINSNSPELARISVDPIDLAVEALSQYLLSIQTRSTRFHRFRAGHDRLSEVEAHGMRLFAQHGCSNCHTEPNFTDNAFHDIGLNRRLIVLQTVTDHNDNIRYMLGHDYGRGNVESGTQHLFAFRTPSLLNVSRTAPYMHDGRFPSLEDVLWFYERSMRERSGRAEIMSRDDMRAILAFLETLNDDRPVYIPRQ